MHILMLSDVYFPRINGVSTSIQTFSTSLLEMGHQITLIAPDYPQAHQEAFEIIRIPSKRLPFDPEDRLMSLRKIKRLVPQLADKQIDLLHIHTPFVAHYAGVALGQQLRLKTITSYHTFFEAYFEKYLPWLPSAWLRTVARRYSRKQCNQVDAIISPSRQMLAKLREYGVQTQSAVIPTGLPARCFTQAPDPDFRSHHRVPEDAQLLLYVGRVAHEKNIGFLIDMFQRVAQRSRKAHLMIAGEGPALNSLKKHAQQLGLTERIHFAGYLDRNTELLSCYQQSDIFVFASETETQGLVLLEAMASGLPVIACASMGSLDVLQEGEGCHIAPLQEEQFANKVLELIEHPDQANRLSQKGRAYANRWSADAMARELLAFYHQLIEEQPAPTTDPTSARQ